MSAPAVYQTLKQEIKNGISAGCISNPVTNEEAKNLKYVQAVIREGMRLNTPVNFAFPKRVPAPGDTICGRFLPEGTNVFVNYHSILHNKEVFGKDADIFRPERFLGDAESARRMTKTVDMMFGGGRYMCLGKPLALIELNKVFVEVSSRIMHVRRSCTTSRKGAPQFGLVENQGLLTLFPQLFRVFDFQVATPEKPWKREKFGTIWVLRDYWARVAEDTTMS